MIFKKLKAGALQLTLFIAVVIALLLAAFLILISTYQKFNLQTDFVIETTHNANKGIEYALRHTTPLNETTSVNLKDESYKSLKTQRAYWGLFEKITSKSNIKTYTFEKVGLVGAEQPEMSRTALYVEDNNKPLVVVGNTKIQGFAYLPQRGVKSGTIAGHSYYGEQLIYGNTKTSGHLPKLTSEITTHLNHITNGGVLTEESLFLDIIKEREFKNSFLEPLQTIYSPNIIRLENINLTGHIVVQSQSAIVVDATANLKDVVLIAPQIDIRDNVVGTFQAIASESITVGINCKLQYPSALVVYDTDILIDSPQTPQGITIGKTSTIEGVVVCITTTTPQNYEAQIVIDEGAIVRGEVYCNNNLELKGSVYGSVFTSNFIAKQSGSIYQNHIYNGKIIIDELPQQYVGLTFDSSTKNVIKWLY